MNRVLKARLRERGVVTLKSGESFIGVLFELDRQALVLRQAEAVGAAARSENLPLDGEVLLLLADVAYIQRL